jgi:hypothetical protein
LRNYKELNTLNYNGIGTVFLAKKQKNNTEELLICFSALHYASVKVRTQGFSILEMIVLSQKRMKFYQNIAYIYSLNGELGR